MIAWEIDAESIEIDLGKTPGLLLSLLGEWGGWGLMIWASSLPCRGMPYGHNSFFQ